ncbi:unnamed protein product, partial [Meganyctiphanes norvegica]
WTLYIMSVTLLGATNVRAVPALEVSDEALPVLPELQLYQQEQQQHQHHHHQQLDHQEDDNVGRVRRDTSDLEIEWTPETNACIIDNNDNIFSIYSLYVCKSVCEFVHQRRCMSIEFYPDGGGCAISEATSRSLSYRKPCPNRNVIFTEISSQYQYYQHMHFIQVV